MATFIFPQQQVSIPGVATEATLLQVLAETQAINTNTADVATETTLASLEAKDFATETTLAAAAADIALLEAKDFATETTLTALNTKVSTVDTSDVTITSSVLPTGAATEATLSALDAKVTAVDTGNVTIASSALPTGAATETSLSAAAADLADLNARLAGSLVPEEFDYQEITYVGATERINTVTYKTGGSGGTTVAVLTLGYDGNDRLTSVTRS